MTAEGFEFNANIYKQNSVELIIIIITIIVGS